MICIPFNRPIIKGDKHEYGRGATTYLPQHVFRFWTPPSASDERTVAVLSGVRCYSQALGLGANQRPASEHPIVDQFVPL